jgi:phenylacetate-CoA ligase
VHTYPKYYDERIETMPRGDIEHLQEGLLLQLLPYAYQRSALVREVWDAAGVKPQDIRSLADFKDKAPFIDKDRIRAFRDQHNDPYGGTRCADPPHMKGVGLTSGTTGDPTPIPYSRSMNNEQTKRDFWHIGMRPGDYYTIDLFTFREGHGGDSHTDVGFRPITFQHSPTEIPRIFEASLKYQPKVIFTVSTPMVIAYEEYAKKHNIDLREVFASYQGAIFGGEAVPPRVRRLLKEWGLEMYEITSLGDVTGAIDCSAHAGFHTWEDQALVECLDPNGDDPVADGERGELVVTALQDDVAPLIRYRTDDLVTFTREPCLCGRTHGRIQVLGRKGDEMIIAGRSILPKDIHPYIEEWVETQAALYQIIRISREMDELRLRIGYNPDALQRSEAELAGALRERLAAELQVPVTVELTPNAELLKLGPPHKIPRVTKQ